jgi:thiamine phosphate synthase YjbQ (UPF0047 family)
MGGRGASSGFSHYKNREGAPYGSQYHSVLTSGNVKFVVKNSKDSETLMETMTRGRVYATVGDTGKIQSIVYFDNDNKRTKQIDLQHVHVGKVSGEKMRPHVHHGYNHNENDGRNGAAHLTTDEKKMVDRVLSTWEQYKKRGVV